MPRLVWLVLNDGSSVVAGCGLTTRATFEQVLAQPGNTLTFTSDDHVDTISSSSVRDFVLFDARGKVPAASAIYRLVHV